MDFFSKNKVMLWTIVFLVALNIFTVSVILFREFRPPHPFGEFPDRPRMNKGDRVMHFLADELELGVDQIRQLKKMRSNHFRQTKEINMEINRLKRELMDESFSKGPDSSKISTYSKEIGVLWSQMARLNYDHFHQVSTILDTTQLRKFKELVQRVIPMRGPPEDHMGRRGRKERRP